MLNLSPHRLSTRFTLLALIALSALLLCSVAFAQTSVSDGSISGTVTDASGAVVPNAKVTMTGPTGQTVHATTSGAGTYSSGALVPGTYSVRAEAKGFKTTQLSVDVQVNNTANGSIKLEVGQESTVVEVQSSEVAVNTEQAEVQGVLTASQISNLPVNGRNFLDLAQLEPGVQIQDGENFDPTKVGYSSISFGGRFGRTARINVDGVDVSDETVGTTTEDIPASSIQEFSLAQSSLDLSNDLTSSGAVNVTTKSGTDAFHGEAFGFFRDSSVGAAHLPEPFLTTDSATGAGHLISAPYQRNQEGADIGGPIKKDKLFFFMDGERTLQHQTAPVLEAAPFQSYSGTFQSPFKETELTGRLDYSLTKTARLFGRFNYFQNSAYATFFSSSFSVYNNKDYTRNEVVGLDFNTGSFTHTIRFSYLKFQNQIVDAVTGSNLPFANLGVNIFIGSFNTGPNELAPQSTPQSDHQIKYDGSKIIGKHILRYGFGFNHIQGGGFASFFGSAPQISGNTPAPDGNPLDDHISQVLASNGQGFSTTQAALGFPAGGLGPDNRIALYIGDSWKLRTNLTVALGLRWERDTGRTDSDLPAIAPINQFFPGHGNAVNNPNHNFAPQLGVAWDPKGDGKTVVRGGIGLYYENVIFNNVLFDRPARLQNGAFLQIVQPCSNGTGVIGPDPAQLALGETTATACSDTIGNAASTIAAFENTFKANTPFSLTNPNGAYIGNFLTPGSPSFGANVNIYNNSQGLFDSNYVSPRAVQMNLGVQHEIRHGMVFSADLLRNVETHALLGVDLNRAGDITNFNPTNASAAISATETAFGHPGDLQSTINAGAKLADFVKNNMGSPLDTGGACACAFTGTNPALGQFYMLEPVSRSVYNALQMKLTENVVNPAPGLKAVNFQVAYSLSRFVNPLAFQGPPPPGNPTAQNDQDFVLTAMDNNQPLRFMGPSLLDRTHQVSFGGSLDVAYGLRFGVISHFYSPLSSPAIIGQNFTPGQIYQTDFTGGGLENQPMPGTTNGSFMRQFGVTGLNNAINGYNATYGNEPTPAGQKLVSAGLFTVAQLQQIGAVAPIVAQAPPNQLLYPWVRALDFRASWVHRFDERLTIEPSVGFFNVANFSNFNQPPGVMTGWLTEGSGSINSIPAGTQSTSAQAFRVGNGTGVFGLGSPRVLEFGLHLTF